MKIYLASGAPGNEAPRERGMLDIPRRLLSYFYIRSKALENHHIFNCIKNENISGRRDDGNER
jgi:hypothetical protein